MNVAIIAFNNVKYSPYIRSYSDYFEKNNICYDVILPNRNGFDEELGNKLYSIKWSNNKSKCYNFMKFAKETKRILKKNHYDFIVVLTTMPAVLLSTFLVRNYKNKYIVDIRDYTHEDFYPFYKLEEYVLKFAKLRVISSLGFKKFLPKFNYCLCHNTSYNLSASEQTFDKKSSGKITIGYVGSIAYVARCKHLIDLVDKDERFEFHFFGNESKGTEISSYIKSINSERIKFFGAYEPTQKAEIIRSVDLLFNVYGNETPLVKYAVSNKLYDSFFFKKPLLTSPNTVMSEYAGNYSFDISFSTDSLDALFDWYNSLNNDALINFMNSCLEKYSQDVIEFKQCISDVVEGNE